MIEIKDKKIFIGDFHTHWYWDKENPTLFISGMYNLGYDFVLLCDGYKESKKMDNFCKIYEIPFKVFPGKELANENAHIILWIDEKFESYIDKIPINNPYNFLREKSKLIIFAHPAKNWKDSFDGTYQPLLNLYKENLIDGIQPESGEVYKIFEKNNVKISVVGGFDIHCCKPFIRYPFYLFNKFNTFQHIIPCSKYASCVISDDLSEESIINSIKNSLSVSFNIETFEFIGDKEIIKFLIFNDFIKKIKEEQKKRGEIKIRGNVFVGEFGEILFEKSKKIKYFIIPSDSLFETKKVKKLNRIRINQILNRENYYIPLTMKDEKTLFYGIYVKTPLSTKINSIVKKIKDRYVPFIEVIIKNRTKDKKKGNLILVFEKEKKEYSLCVNKIKKLLIPVKINDFGIEYDAKIKLNLQNFDIVYPFKIAFCVCKYTKNPWEIDRNTSIKIIKENIYNFETWHGINDFSGEMNLYWDEKYFYLYAEIIDDIFYQKWSNWETFWGDSIQFAFGPFLRKIDAYGFNYELIISKTDKGNEIFIWNEYGKIGQTRKLFKEGTLDVIRDEENKKTIYKLKMPWKFFKEFKPIENKRFLFSIIVFDNDGIIMNRKWFYFGENIGVRKSMKNAHTVTLIK
ncbi:MAG: hypothetical protein NC833_02645 [Candidatus Omnitrophica bacterium]|nr:hypothetical protein [Candidatus Omnitrophota bacterium]